MEKLGKKENVLKIICTLLCATVLFCSSFTACAQTDPKKLIQPIQTPTPLSYEAKGNVSILDENFSVGSMPPSGWTLNTTNADGTWEIESTRYHSIPNSASVWRGSDCHGLQNEWLTTPGLNFSKYVNPDHTNKIYMHFWWYTDIYVVQHSLIFVNVSVSTNGGTSWTKIWTTKGQSGFPQYNFSLWNMPIALSDYRNESNVMIGFQFYSNTEEEAIAQYFAIDDILIWTTGPVNFSCDVGGPYKWWWSMQLQYMPIGVRFHGQVSPGFNPFLCHWLWDFGDGTTSQLPLTTWHYYDKTGLYNITLQVTYGKNVSFDNTTLYLFLMPPPDLGVKLKTSFGGLQAEINNPGEYNATNVSWSMKVFLGPLQMREKIVANGNIDDLGNHTTVPIKSNYFFGFGRIHVEIMVTPENIGGIDKHFYAIKIGPIILAFS